MDQEAIKRALDAFENDKFSDAQDILRKEITTRRDEFLEEKLELKEGFNFEKKKDDDDDDDDGDKKKKKKKDDDDDDDDDDESEDDD